MKKIILLFSFLLFALNSCSSSDDIDTQEQIDLSGNILLKKTITTKGSVVTTDTYFYVGYKIDKILTADGTNNDETKFTYTGDLITKIENYSNAILKSKKEYTYQNDKITQCMKYEYSGGTLSAKKKTVYNHHLINGNEQVADYEVFSINLSNNQETIISDGTVYFSGTTVSSQINTDYPIIAGGRYNDRWEEYTFNVKKNPTINIIGYEKLFDNVEITSDGNLYNIKRTADEYVNGSWTTVVSSYKRLFTYNELFFPIERKIYDRNEVLDNTTQFFYE
ncbi:MULTISPECIES: hypothetical protein [Flavobacterium]|uniref:Uncharacterized protein n=1 Tax=Flavobacterium hankyongi TaxID=1176532 RepID=A0ABP8ZU48_9FLAO|nr:hypothetical protein [Flavobacterium sp. N1846]